MESVNFTYITFGFSELSGRNNILANRGAYRGSKPITSRSIGSYMNR
jgi:hypothetical protein